MYESFIKNLKIERAGLIDEIRATIDGASTLHRDLSGEEDGKVRRIETAIGELETEIASWEGKAARNVEADQARSGLDAIIRPVIGAYTREESDFAKFLRGSGGRAFEMVLERDLTTATASSVVPTTTANQLYGYLDQFSPIRKAGARVAQTSGGEVMRFPVATARGTAAIVGEGTALAENDAVLSYVQLGAYKYGQITQLSRELIEDNAVDIVTWVGEDSMEAIARATGHDYCLASGTNAPHGYTTTVCHGTVVGGTAVAGAPSFNNVIDLVHSVTEPYRQNAAFVVADSWFAATRKLVDDQHRPIFLPSMVPGMPDQLLGYPVFVDPNLPAVAAGTAATQSAYYGDWNRAYLIRDAGPIRWERSDDYAFSADISTFRSVMRTDGNVLDQRAYATYKGGTA